MKKNEQENVDRRIEEYGSFKEQQYSRGRWAIMVLFCAIVLLFAIGIVLYI